MDFNDQHAGIVTYNDLSKRDIRGLILHILYALESLDYEDSLMSVIDNFNRGFDLAIPMNSELVKTVDNIVTDRNLLDQAYMPYLDNWRFERISIMVKLILRFAVWELQQGEVDKKIIINEAIELAKRFAEKDAYRFVNGVLDKYVKALPKKE
ncbi:MAG TPA: transcription antitermination factor NusB [Patescibacteria group bacterium]|jgi:N utilization substance protein B|nr:transcription antitermination factor NusB [Patescibacteria group bacterium]